MTNAPAAVVEGAGPAVDVDPAPRELSARSTIDKHGAANSSNEDLVSLLKRTADVDDEVTDEKENMATFLHLDDNAVEREYCHSSCYCNDCVSLL